MNNEIRLLLIDQARKGVPISYGDIMKKLNLDHDNVVHRNELSSMLYEISEYEHQHNRPLLSSIAMYSGLTEHGPGFYELAEQFGYGNKKILIERLFAFEQMKACETFWKDTDNFKQFLAVIEPRNLIHKMDFYTEDEIEFLSRWGGKVYDKDSEDHVAAKNYIMSSLGSKTKYWSEELVKMLPGFDTFNWRMWSQKGWVDSISGKVRVARFKHYTWARIFRKGDDNKDVFFTVGVDGETKQIVYKIDYYKETNSHLSPAQKEIVNRNIPKELEWKAISFNSLNEYSWDKLLTISHSFITENAHIYDKLISLAWGGKSPEEAFSNTLRKQQKPQNGLIELPPLNPTFSGTDKDFIQNAIDNKEIGTAGEELVLHYEKTWLKNSGFQELADKVTKVKDGKGFDIQSYTSNGKPKYIEVKTTTGSNGVPFDYSINEYLFAERNVGSYQIYRLYNYDEECNTADFYVIDNPLKELQFQPNNFKVYNKA